MTLDEYNRYCSSLTATSHVVQWRGAHVWKVGDKVFAIGRVEGNVLTVIFKTSPLSYDILKDQAGLRPAPYMASRGMKWIQHYTSPGLNYTDLAEYLSESHRLVALGLSKKKQKELGLLGC